MRTDETAQPVPALDSLLCEFNSLDADDPRRMELLLEIGDAAIAQCRHHSASGMAGEYSALSADNRAVTVRALELRGAHLADRGEYPAALECYFECIRLQESAPDPIILGVAWMEIGAMYGQMGDLDRALDSFRSSAEQFKAGGNYYLEIKAASNIAAILRVWGNHAEALIPTLRCLAVFEELNDRDGIAESLAGLGEIYRQTGDAEGAICCTRRAVGMLSVEEYPALRGALLINLGNLYRAGGHTGDAINTLETATTVLRRHRDPQLHARLHEAIALACEQAGDPVRALRHYRRAMIFDNQHWGNQQQAKVAELRVRFEMEQVRSERDRYRHQAQELRQEVYAKTRELASMSLNLVRKSEFLEEMRRQLGQVAASSQARSTGLVQPLLEDLRATIKADDTWTMFEEQYNETHRDFMRTLAERFPLLTPTELKICALTRFGLSTKEIANMLYVSVRNVQNHRYRIRKKFSLDSEANLTSFLAAM